MKKTLLSITILLVVVSSFIFKNEAQQDKNLNSSRKDILQKPKPVLNRAKSSDSSSDTNLVRINLDSLGIINELKYATEDNFLKQKIYPCAECYLRVEAARALLKINSEANLLGYRLVVFDCYRPYSAQVKMFSIMPDDRYVADPKKGASNHNKGIALDISISSKRGELLDMGSAFDEFSEKSHYSYSNISKNAKKNRKTLKELMVNGGFEPYENEWWHFSFKNKKYEISDFSWSCD
jgi:D-alanyl-D-alanine dipeptidase